MKVVTIPQDNVTVVDKNGEVIGATNAFFHYLNTVLESKPQDSDLDTAVVHEVSELMPKDGDDVPATITMSDSHMECVLSGIKHLREQKRIVGKGWWYLISALKNAHDSK